MISLPGAKRRDGPIVSSNRPAATTTMAFGPTELFRMIRVLKIARKPSSMLVLLSNRASSWILMISLDRIQCMKALHLFILPLHLSPQLASVTFIQSALMNVSSVQSSCWLELTSSHSWWTPFCKSLRACRSLIKTLMMVTRSLNSLELWRGSTKDRKSTKSLNKKSRGSWISSGTTTDCSPLMMIMR